MVDEDDHQIATRIAQKLRHAGPGCEIVTLVPTEPAVLRRDRIVIVLALALLTALAWSYLLCRPSEFALVQRKSFQHCVHVANRIVARSDSSESTGACWPLAATP